MGKSTVAALCACVCAERGLKTLLFDADFQFGNCARLLGVTPGNDAITCSFEDILDGLVTPTDLARHATTTPALISALYHPERAEQCPEAFASVLDEACRVFDAVVVNTSAWWTEVQASLIERASQVFYVLDQRPQALRDATSVISLCGRCGLPTGAFTVLLNRVKRGALYQASDVANVLNGLSVVELKDGGMEVTELMACGQAQGLLTAYNPLAASVEDLLADYLPDDSSSWQRNMLASDNRAGLAKVRRFFG